MNTPTRGEQSTGSSNHFWNYFATNFNAYLILRKFPTYNFIENFLKISRNVSLFFKVRCFDVIGWENFHRKFSLKSLYDYTV